MKNPRAIYHLHYVWRGGWGGGGIKHGVRVPSHTCEGGRCCSDTHDAPAAAARTAQEWRAHSLWWHRLLLGALTLHWRHVGLRLYYCGGRIVSQ